MLIVADDFFLFRFFAGIWWSPRRGESEGLQKVSQLFLVIFSVIENRGKPQKFRVFQFKGIRFSTFVFCFTDFHEFGGIFFGFSCFAGKFDNEIWWICRLDFPDFKLPYFLFNLFFNWATFSETFDILSWDIDNVWPWLFNKSFANLLILKFYFNWVRLIRKTRGIRSGNPYLISCGNHSSSN